MHEGGLRRFSLTQFYVFLIYFFSISFVVSATAITSGISLNTNATCGVSIRLCLGLYACSKVAM
jgi:hypothetical protein